MPTGYTADIKDGIDFKTYAMNCARAFGACVMLRDEPSGGDRIPSAFEPSDYHAKAVEKARNELAALEAMTPKQLKSYASDAWEKAEKYRLACLEEKKKQREAYESMLAKARAWTPPTPDHEGLHTFMQTQIEKSIEFDCDESYYATPTLKRTGAEWAKEQREKLTRDVRYHEREHAGEVERAAKRTAWVQALRESLSA